MILVQVNGGDSPQDCPFDRLRNTEDQVRNGSRTLSGFHASLILFIAGNDGRGIAGGIAC
jgi:hypothetical protein